MDNGVRVELFENLEEFVLLFAYVDFREGDMLSRELPPFGQPLIRAFDGADAAVPIDFIYLSAVEIVNNKDGIVLAREFEGEGPSDEAIASSNYDSLILHVFCFYIYDKHVIIPLKLRFCSQLPFLTCMFN